jgi:2-polyprenyl-6-methoxyphenol hydroxylase-like FAD-dependent oxidoreductase
MRALAAFCDPDDGTGGRPEVQRGELRRILLDSLPTGTVRWGHKVSSVRVLGEGRHEVGFADGTTVGATVLVGADGAWSRVRPLLSGAASEYVGMSYVETYLFDADTRHPAATKVVGGGSLWALAPGKGIMAHRESGGTLHAYVALSEPQDWFADVDFADPPAAVARIAGEFVGWAPELRTSVLQLIGRRVRRRSSTPLPAHPIGDHRGFPAGRYRVGTG